MSTPRTTSNTVLEARGLAHRFSTGAGDGVVAVDHVDLEIREGEVVGLVGESGSGKTTLGKLLLHIIAPNEGHVAFEGQDLAALSRRERRRTRSRMQMIYQTAAASLNPGLTVGQHLEETIRLHRPEDAHRADALVDETLAAFRLTGKRALHPNQLSGGEQRRVVVARSLLPRPSLLVADEPTAGLDASVKADVIDLLRNARGGRTAFLFISHELDVVRYVADRVLVMYRGRIVEDMPAAALDPRNTQGQHHPYTERLLSAAFKASRRLTQPEGRPTEDLFKTGCSYRAACHRADPDDASWSRCTQETPALVPLGSGHGVSCHLLAPSPTETS